MTRYIDCMAPARLRRGPVPKVTEALLRAYLKKHPTATAHVIGDHFKVTRQYIWKIASESGILLAGSPTSTVQYL